MWFGINIIFSFFLIDRTRLLLVDSAKGRCLTIGVCPYLTLHPIALGGEVGEIYEGIVNVLCGLVSLAQKSNGVFSYAMTQGNRKLLDDYSFIV